MTRFRSLVFAVMVLMVAQAANISVQMQFGDAAWSGSFAFDDTTGQAFSPAITAFALTALDISHGTTRWTLPEWETTPPAGGAIRDTNGTIALFGTATESEIGSVLFSSITFTFLDGLIVGAELRENSGPFSGYSTAVGNVPIPAAAWLFGSAMLGLVAVKRKKA